MSILSDFQLRPRRPSFAEHGGEAAVNARAGRAQR